MNRSQNQVRQSDTNDLKTVVYTEGWLDHIPHDGPRPRCKTQAGWTNKLTTKLLAPPDFELTEEYILRSLMLTVLTR